MTEGSRDESRLLALRQRAAAAALLGELAPGLSGQTEEGASLVAALAAEGHDLTGAARGDARALAQRLDLPVLAHRSAPVLHVVAVLFERLAAQLESHGDDTLPAAVSLRRRALEAWLHLGRQHSYLSALLARVAREGEAAAATTVIERRARTVLEAWIEAAQAPLLAGRVQGRVMLGLLRELERDPEWDAVARDARESLIDALLAPLRAEDLERLAGRAPTGDRIAGFVRWAELWHATLRDGYLALRTLERLVDLGWELRSGSKYAELNQLYAPFQPMLGELVLEVRRGGAAASYASLVGDAYVQLASAETSTAAKIADCERALYVCPRHKLAESVLAFYLAHRGLELLEAGHGKPSAAVAAEIEALLARARTLDPTDSRVLLLTERYRSATGRTL